MEGRYLLWKALLLIAAGTLLLRIAGRKSISQMSIGTTVIMISIGTVIVQPVANENVLQTIGTAAVFIVFLLGMEWLTIRSDRFESFIQGKAEPLIRDGQLVNKNLKRLRMTSDSLEMRLRQYGVTRLEDVENATLEPNGLVGYELKRHARPVTLGDLEQLLGKKMPDKHTHRPDLFDEVNRDGHNKPEPKHLQ